VEIIKHDGEQERKFKKIINCLVEWKSLPNEVEMDG
jgi:hypothetical protein